MLTVPPLLKRHTGIVVMGVCGTGKSVIAKSLAEHIANAMFLEGDDFHPISNIETMKAGIPLTDQHRESWLEGVGSAIEASRLSRLTICSCSALKKKYRDQLRRLSPSLVFIHLDGDKALIEQRMNTREHFMPTALLDSQLSTLEPPKPSEEHVIVCDIQQPPEEIIEALITNNLASWIAPHQHKEVAHD